MRPSLLTLVLGSLFSILPLSSVLAQTGCVINGINWCDEEPMVPVTDFPISGMSFGGYGEYQEVNQFKKWGMNAIYPPGGDRGKHEMGQYMRNGMKIYDRFQEIHDGAASGTYANIKWTDSWRFEHTTHLTETRFFLASNEDAIPDLDERWMYNDEVARNWKKKAPITSGNYEAQFLFNSTTIDNSGYLLRDLDCYVDPIPAKRDLAGPLNQNVETVWVGSDSAYCDFIFRFDPLDLLSFNNNDSLFLLEYDVILNDSTIISGGSQLITKGNYNTYLGLSTSAKNEHDKILRFPQVAPALQVSFATNDYAVFRKGLPLQGFAPKIPVSIDCRLKRLTPVSIFVRGLRVRSKMADLLLKHDAGVVAHIQSLCSARVDLLKDSVHDGISAWSNVIGFSAGNEPKTWSFRPFAELDKLVRQFTGKSIHPFLSNNLQEGVRHEIFRAIYEDQTGEAPPLFGAENLMMFAPHGGAFPYPSDAIDFALRSRNDFISFRTPVTGQDLMPDTDTASYLDYLKVMQGTLNRFSFADAARMAYPSYSRKDKEYGFHAHLSSIMTVKHPVINTTEVPQALRDTMYQRMKRGDCNPWDTVVSALDMGRPAEDFPPDYRSPLMPELRAQAWDGLAYGAKGFVVNVVVSDGGHNIGITDIASLDPETAVDYDANSTDGLSPLLGSNFQLGTCEDPFFGPQTFPDEPNKFTHHVIKPKIHCDSNREQLQNHPRLIPVFSDIAFTFRGRSYSVGTKIDSIVHTSGSDAGFTDIQNYVDFKNSLDLPDFKVLGEIGHCWVPSIENINPICSASTVPRRVWTAWSPELLCSIWGEYGTPPFYDSWRYPYTTFRGFRSWLPMYYGFKERQRGVLRVAEDIQPIASTLKKLRWVHGFGLSHTSRVFNLGSSDIEKRIDSLHRRNATKGLDMWPLKNVSSQHVEPLQYDDESSTKWTVKNVFDTDDSSFYNIGLYEDREDIATKYLVIANRRTWPVYFRKNGSGETVLKIKDSSLAGSPQPLIGAIDVRAFNFQVDRFKVDSNSVFFIVENLRLGTETYLHRDSTYTLFLEPGEGTLLKIKPATSYIVGKTSEGGMEYNNGHRVANLSSNQRVMTWEKGGDIQYAIVNNPGQNPDENFFNPGTLSSSTLDGTDLAFNPSVAAKIGASGKDTVAIVWSRDFADDKRLVLARFGVKSTTGGISSLSFQPTVTLDTVPIIDDADRPTPVVTPTHNGFFIAWASHKNVTNEPEIQSAFVMRGAVSWAVDNWNEPLRANPDPVKVLFPTVASRLEFDVDSANRRKDRIHLAWEEWTSDEPNVSSHIYYAWIDRKYPVAGASGESEILEPEEPDGSSYDRVSKGHPSCEHHHPHIAVRNRYQQTPLKVLVGGPIVTWEVVTCKEKNEGAVLLRSRAGENEYDQPNPWSSFTQFYKKWHNKMPQPQVRAGQNGFSGSDPETRAVIYHDHTIDSIMIERLPNAGKWQRSIMLESGQNPSVVLPYMPQAIQTLNTWTFRGTAADENSLYNARITARTSGNVRFPRNAMAHTLSIQKNEACGSEVAFMAGNGSVGCPTCPEEGEDPTATDPRRQIDWLVKDLSRDGFGEGKPRSTTTGLPYVGGATYPWTITEDSIRTNYFTVNSGDAIKMDHYFSVSDSAWLASQFTDTSQFIKIELLLKDSASHTVSEVLKSYEIKLLNPLPAASKLKITSNPHLLALGRFGQAACPIKSLILIQTKGDIDPPDSFAIAPPASGKGYLTIRVTKDIVSDFDLNHMMESYDNFGEYVGEFEEFLPGAPKITIAGSSKAKSSIRLRAYPNPFSNYTTIELEGVPDALTVLQVFDVSGREVQTLFTGNTPKDGSLSVKLLRDELTDGTYYVRAVSGSEVTSQRIVVVK